MNIEDSIIILKNIKKLVDIEWKHYVTDAELSSIETLLIAYEKQNKIIDLMAEDLKTPVNSKEWIIEYYKKRCENAKD